MPKLEDSILTEENYQLIKQTLSTDNDLVIELYHKTCDRLTVMLLSEIMRLRGINLPDEKVVA